MSETNGAFASRDIFPYQAHGKVRYGDPLALLRTLEMILGGDLWRWTNDCHAPEVNVALTAYDKLRQAVCAAFKLGVPFSEDTGQGILDAEWIGVLNDFQEWLEKNAARAENTPKSSASGTISAAP